MKSIQWFKYKKQVIISLAVCCFIVLLFFLLRNYALNKVIGKIDEKIYTRFHLHLSTEKARFAGLRTIELYNLQVKDITKDPILSSDKIFFKIKILPIFAGNVRLSKIYIKDFRTRIDSTIIDRFSNYRKSDSISIADTIKINYDYVVNKIFNSFFAFIPDEVIVDSALFTYTRNDNRLYANIPNLYLKKGLFNFDVYLSEDKENICNITGNFNKSQKEINFYATNPLNKPVTLPYLSSKLGLTVKFDTLGFNLYSVEKSSDMFSFYTQLKIENLYVEHKKIAPSAVITNHFYSNFKVNIGDRYIEIDSASIFKINNFTFSPYIKYARNGEREVFLKIPHFTFEASDMFSSFPKGLFKSVSDMRVSGEMSYDFNGYVNLDNTDSVVVSSNLVSKGFRIEKYGLANLQMLNDTFVYNVYEKNELVNSFEISPENPNFISFAEIPSILTYSVLTSEDGGFFHHRGFSEESFKKAISDNLKEGRFARGGSTITMQLVKNVFLNKNKTISRKLEEMLIVWMIENMHLVSKERMLEVYLNIIEWGPNVYGIKQASKYYFNKQPKDLSLQECIFLASIIPSPKKFKYAFKAPGKLNDYYAWFYKRIPEVMIRREQLSPNDTIGLKPEVALKGEAKNYIEMDSVLNAKFFQYEGNDDE
jgi:hypothetical protein